MTNKQKGYNGEEIASNYLKQQGLKIIKRNFKGLHGEVDIIGEDSGETLAFVEVKSWSVYGYDSLEYAINKAKQRHIISASLEFIEKNPQYACYALRFDVLFYSRKREEIHYIKYAFEGDGAPL
jgi:putative endonuclease